MDRCALKRIDRKRLRVAGKNEDKISCRAFAAKSPVFWSQPISIQTAASHSDLIFALGTDSLASNESLNLFAEMRAFQRSEPESSPEKIFEMITVNPASALRQQNTLGRIRPGFRADLIAIPCGEDRDLFGEIVAFDGEIDWMMVNGKDAEHRE